MNCSVLCGWCVSVCVRVFVYLRLCVLCVCGCAKMTYTLRLSWYNNAIIVSMLSLVAGLDDVHQACRFSLAPTFNPSHTPPLHPPQQVIAETLKDTPALPAYAVTVGKKPTAAAAYIDDPSAVLELLVSLNKYSDKEKRYFSAMDLPSQAAQGSQGEYLCVVCVVVDVCRCVGAVVLCCFVVSCAVLCYIVLYHFVFLPNILCASWFSSRIAFLIFPPRLYVHLLKCSRPSNTGLFAGDLSGNSPHVGGTLGSTASPAQVSVCILFSV